MAEFRTKPLDDRVIVKPSEVEEKTKGGIILPDTAKEKPIEGTIVAIGNCKIGEDRKLIPMNVKVNDKVLYAKYAGSEIQIHPADRALWGLERVLLQSSEMAVYV